MKYLDTMLTPTSEDPTCFELHPKRSPVRAIFVSRCVLKSASARFGDAEAEMYALEGKGEVVRCREFIGQPAWGRNFVLC